MSSPLSRTDALLCYLLSEAVTQSNQDGGVITERAARTFVSTRRMCALLALCVVKKSNKRGGGSRGKRHLQ